MNLAEEVDLEYCNILLLYYTYNIYNNYNNNYNIY